METRKWKQALLFLSPNKTIHFYNELWLRFPEKDRIAKLIRKYSSGLLKENKGGVDLEILLNDFFDDFSKTFGLSQWQRLSEWVEKVLIVSGPDRANELAMHLMVNSIEIKDEAKFVGLYGKLVKFKENNLTKYMTMKEQIKNSKIEEDELGREIIETYFNLFPSQLEDVLSNIIWSNIFLKEWYMNFRDENSDFYKELIRYEAEKLKELGINTPVFFPKLWFYECGTFLVEPV